MSQSEFDRWVDYYMLSPFDDLHRYHRPAAFVARSMAGGKISEMIEWLENSQPGSDMSDADLATLQAFGIKPRSLSNGK